MNRRRVAALAVAVLVATALLTAVGAGPAQASTHGPYSFMSWHSGRCMEVYGWNKFDGAAMNRWDCHGHTNQQWYLDQYLDGSEAIRGVDSNKCTQSHGPSYGIHIATCTGAARQRWRARLRPQGVAMESVAFPGYCLRTQYGGDNGVALVLGPCITTDTGQEWVILPPGSMLPIPPGRTFHASHGGKCMDVLNGSTGPGTAVVQWDCHGGGNQRWYISPYLEDNQGVSLIWNKHSGMCLTAGNPSLVYTAFQDRCTGLYSQRWYATGHSVSTGFTWYTFQSAHYPNMCLSVHLGTWNTNNGAASIRSAVPPETRAACSAGFRAPENHPGPGPVRRHRRDQGLTERIVRRDADSASRSSLDTARVSAARTAGEMDHIRDLAAVGRAGCEYGEVAGGRQARCGPADVADGPVVSLTVDDLAHAMRSLAGRYVDIVISDPR